MHMYKLVDKKPVPVDTVIEWGESFAKDRQVAFTDTGRYRVSTIFLGLDHRWGEGDPLLFETMVFRNTTFWDKVKYVLTGNRNAWWNSARDVEQIRCSTWEQAEAQHKDAVERWK